MRVPVSGHATGVPDATQGINLIGAAITSGREFHLQKAWFFKDIVGESRVGLFNLAAAVALPSTTALQFMLAFPYEQDHYELVDFGDPGLKFTLGCVVGLQAGSTCTGMIVCGGMGYEL